MMSQSKKAQMKIVRETGFAMLDAALYLDTHPKDEKAMDYFNKYQTLYREACKEYEACYGPLTHEGVDTNQGWTWTRDPWPREGACCEGGHMKENCRIRLLLPDHTLR